VEIFASLYTLTYLHLRRSI